MSWDAVILADATNAFPLLPHVKSLFAQQRSTWEALRNGEAAWATIRSRRLNDQGSEIVVQSNPGRSQSTNARVDPDTIAQRPCFLCPHNMPREERGIAVGSLVLLPNPFPILPQHCTIPSREHRPQRLTGQVSTLLALARAVGPDMFVFYNGSRCGASAPDHFHFQACCAADVPLLSEVRQTACGRTVHHSFGRSVLVAADQDPAAIERFIQQSLQVLARGETPPSGHFELEPMVNVMVLCRDPDDPDYVCIVVPRSVHRPACYFETGPARLAISPGALEMAGVLVVAELDQFDRVDAGVARAIYEEVSLPPNRFAQVANAVV